VSPAEVREGRWAKPIVHQLFSKESLVTSYLWRRCLYRLLSRGRSASRGRGEGRGQRETRGRVRLGWMVARGRSCCREAGMTTAEYAIGTLAACGFAALLVTILRSGEVQGLLLGIIRRALALGG
jgi:hypothetical protein